MAALPSVAKGRPELLVRAGGRRLAAGVSHVFHTWGIVPGHDTHTSHTISVYITLHIR